MCADTDARVLIIEDEPDILTYLTTVLEDHHYHAYALDFQDNLHASITKFRPHLIILDVMMPKRSGISIYRELRTSAEFRNVPVAILSGLPIEGDAISGNFRAMLNDETIPEPDAFIDKPVDLNAFIDLVRRLTATAGCKD